MGRRMLMREGQHSDVEKDTTRPAGKSTMYEFTEVDRAEQERDDTRREFAREPRHCYECGRLIRPGIYHHCPAGRPERPDR